MWQKTVPLVAAGTLGNGVQFIAPTAFLCCAAALFPFLSFFVERPWLLYSGVAIGAGAPFLFLAPSGTLAFGFFGSAVLACFAAYRMNREFHLSFSFLLSKIVKYGLPLYFTAMALSVSVFYIESVRADGKDPLSFLLPRPLANFLLERTADAFAPSLGLPVIRPDMPVSDAISLLVSEALRSEGVSLEEVSAEERTRLLLLQREALQNELGIIVREGDTIADTFYLTLAERLRDLLGPYAAYLPFASGVAFFFAFKAFTFPLYVLSIFFAFLLLKLLEFGNLVRVEKRMVEVERLTI